MRNTKIFKMTSTKHSKQINNLTNKQTNNFTDTKGADVLTTYSQYPVQRCCFTVVGMPSSGCKPPPMQ